MMDRNDGRLPCCNMCNVYILRISVQAGFPDGPRELTYDVEDEEGMNSCGTPGARVVHHIVSCPHPRTPQTLRK